MAANTDSMNGIAYLHSRRWLIFLLRRNYLICFNEVYPTTNIETLLFAFTLLQIVISLIIYHIMFMLVRGVHTPTN